MLTFCKLLTQFRTYLL